MTGNILPDSHAAPALQGKEKELAKHMRANSLEKQLQNRPDPETLIKEGILEREAPHLVLMEPALTYYTANENPLAEN